MSRQKPGFSRDGHGEQAIEVNLSAPRPKGRGLLRVHRASRLETPPLTAGLRAAERVNLSEFIPVNIGFLRRQRYDENRFSSPFQYRTCHTP